MEENALALPESMASIAEGYAGMYGTLTGLASDTALSNTALALQFGDRVLQGNYARFPKVIDASLKSSGTASKALNKTLANQYYANLSNVDRNWQQSVVGNSFQSSEDSAAFALESMYQNLPNMLVSAYGDSQLLTRATNANLRGETPADMVSAAAMFAAEKANKQGVFGQAANNMIAKELGLQSLASVQTGIQGAGDAFATAVNPFLNQLATLQQAQQATGNAATVAGALKSPIINTGALFSSNFGQLTGTSMMSPGLAASGLSGLQNAGMNTAIGLWGNSAQLAQNAVVSGYNAQDTMTAFKLANDKGSPWGSVIAGGVSGAASGSSAGPWGALAGGVIGAGAGYYSATK